MEKKLHFIDMQLFELSYAIGLIKFSYESKIKLYRLQKIRNKAKVLGLKPTVNKNSFSKEEINNFLLKLDKDCKYYFDNA
jgi:hypothetical protein